jgi:hypothetical protein
MLPLMSPELPLPQALWLWVALQHRQKWPVTQLPATAKRHLFRRTLLPLPL